MNAHVNQPAQPQSQMQNPFNMNPNNPFFQQFGGYQNFMQQFNSFAQTFPQQLQQMGMATQDPRQAAQMLMNSGKMSPQMFEQLRQQANAMTGMQL